MAEKCSPPAGTKPLPLITNIPLICDGTMPNTYHLEEMFPFRGTGLGSCRCLAGCNAVDITEKGALGLHLRN